MQGHWYPVFRHARTPEQRMKMMLVFNAMDATLALAAATLLYSTQPGGWGTRGHVLIAAACCSVIAAHQINSLIINLKIQSRLKRARAEKAADALSIRTHAEEAAPMLNAADAGLFTPARASVTENTTELLDAVPRQPEQRQTR